MTNFNEQMTLGLTAGIFNLTTQVLAVARQNLEVNTKTLEATLKRNELLEELTEELRKNIKE